METHNKALEDLAKAKQAWNEREVARKNRIAKLRLELGDANKDSEETNRVLKFLKKASSVDTQPTIHNFYEPSSEMKKYQDLTIGTLGLAAGTVGAAIIKAYRL